MIRKNFLLKGIALVLLTIPLQPLLSSAQTFEEQTAIVLAGVSNGTAIWGDYDNDGDLDILLVGSGISKNITKIYRNNGNNSFVEQTGIGVNVEQGESASWGDFNKDGYLDIAITGDLGFSSFISKIYLNHKDNTFTEQVGAISNITGRRITLGDYNNDDNLDVLVVAVGTSKLYQNNGDNTFADQTGFSIESNGDFSNINWTDYNNDGLIDIQRGSKIFKSVGNNSFIKQTSISLVLDRCNFMDWGDYDNDGDLDILASNKMFSNNGGNSFTQQTAISITGSYGAWGDYDNDGWLDILQSGSPVKVLHNNGNNTFTNLTGSVFGNFNSGSAFWGDYDNDGDLDILLTGHDGTTGSSKIYKNNTISGAPKTTNDNPLAPGNLNIISSLNGDITFGWDKATDSETPQNGLSYNLYVYDSELNTLKLSPHAFRQTETENGRRLIAQRGNIQYSASGYTLNNLPTGLYKWSVQAVDGGLKGGAFAMEQSFHVLNLRQVGINVAGGVLTATETTMAYSINSTDGVNGTWTNCTAATTAVNFGTGGFDVWVKEITNPVSKYKVATIAAPITPAFTIDYIAETTVQVVADTVEYSTNADLSEAVIGNGAKLTVIPGQNLYFRLKASAKRVISAIQTLTAPAQPSAPTFSIDFVKETTVENITNLFEYSSKSDMSSLSVGANVKLPIVPDQIIYFRKKATATSFKSLIQALTASRPSAPNYTIDFVSEKTNENVIATDEYSWESWASTYAAGNGQKISVYPNSTCKFRSKASATGFQSQEQVLVVPDRPATPTNPIVSDMNNTFGWTNSAGFPNATDYEYTTNGGTNWVPCTVKPINVGNGYIPATNILVRVKATSSNFRSLGLQANNNFTSITKNFEDFGIRCFPNPVKDKLVLENVPEKGLIEIYFANGILMKSVSVEQGINQIDFTELPKGIYLLYLQFDKTRVQSRVVK